MPSSEAKNLEAIDAAIRQHRERCPGQLVEIRLNPFEVERLGWDDYLGIPIRPDDSLGTGRFRLICEADDVPEQVEAEAESIEVRTPAEAPGRRISVPAPEPATA